MRTCKGGSPGRCFARQEARGCRARRCGGRGPSPSRKARIWAGWPHSLPPPACMQPAGGAPAPPAGRRVLRAPRNDDFVPAHLERNVGRPAEHLRDRHRHGALVSPVPANVHADGELGAVGPPCRHGGRRKGPHISVQRMPCAPRAPPPTRARAAPRQSHNPPQIGFDRSADLSPPAASSRPFRPPAAERAAARRPKGPRGPACRVPAATRAPRAALHCAIVQAADDPPPPHPPSALPASRASPSQGAITPPLARALPGQGT